MNKRSVDQRFLELQNPKHPDLLALLLSGLIILSAITCACFLMATKG
ncbi:MAG TPA: hypothetical protein VGD89_14030 [Flavipsychrobacter sp.]